MKTVVRGLGLAATLLFAIAAYGRDRAEKAWPIEPPLAPERAIVLTFDDGPRPWIIPQLLQLLDLYEIKAAFFLQGWQAEAHPFLVQRLHEEGHIVANHTWNHAPLKWYFDRYGEVDGEERYLKDVEDGSRVIEKIIGVRPQDFFFRPPLWDIRESTLRKLQRAYIVQILDELRFRPQTKIPQVLKRTREIRDVNTGDYNFHALYKKDQVKGRDTLAQSVWRIIKAREKYGLSVHILTFHELPVTIDALKILIPEWKDAGYKFCSLRWIYGLEACK